MKILAHAKINLCIDILQKTTEGYHEIWTIFHEIENLHDELKINETKEADHLSTAQSPQNTGSVQLPKMEENLAYRALKLFKKWHKIDKNADIHLKKNIPVASGLGGASSDAAAVLKALNKLWDINASTSELMSLGAELGMDVPFFIIGGTALGTHFGEKVTPLKPIKNIEFKITDESNWPESPTKSEDKTASLYSLLDLSNCGQNREKTQAMLRAIEGEDSQAILENLHNDFETLYSTKGHLTGSGPATFIAK